MILNFQITKKKTFREQQKQGKISRLHIRTDIILRNDMNITSLVDINYLEKSLYISENLFLEGDLWEITAHSSKIDFNLDVSRTEFYAGQELKFFIADPILDGNYTFVLTDTFEDQINSTTKFINSATESFIYTFPLNSLDGSYKAFVYWYNGTDAGLAIQVFTIIFLYFPLLSA